MGEERATRRSAIGKVSREDEAENSEAYARNDVVVSGKGSVKNPDNEAEKPAPMLVDGQKESSKRGPNTQGNERGRVKQDPEGQQGSTSR